MKARGEGFLYGWAVVPVFLCAAVNSFAAPALSGQEARDFLDGNNGKFIYTKWEGGGYNNGLSLWYLDFSEDNLEEHLLIQETEIQPEQASISPDGGHFIYATSSPDNKIYLCKLNDNAQSTRQFICDGGQPKWWIKKSTGELFMLCNDQNHQSGFTPGGSWPPGGNTYIVKFNRETMEPIGGRELLIGSYANGGRSPDGGMLFTAGRSTGIFHIDKDAVSNAAVGDNYSFGTELGCNPGFSPGGTDEDALVLHNGASDNGTLGFPEHSYFLIRRTNGEIAQYHRKDPSDGNPYTESTRWSSHQNYTTFCAASGIGSGLHNAYAYRLSDDKEIKILDGNYFWPYLWVDDGENKAINSTGFNSKQNAAGSNGQAKKMLAIQKNLSNVKNANIYDLFGRKVPASMLMKRKAGTALPQVLIVKDK